MATGGFGKAAARSKTLLGVGIAALLVLSGCTMKEGDQFAIDRRWNQGDITFSVRASAEIRYLYYVTCSQEPECMHLGIENAEWVTSDKDPNDGSDWGPKAVNRLARYFENEPDDGPGSIISQLGYNEGIDSAGVCLKVSPGGGSGVLNLATADGGLNNCFMGESME